VFKQSGRQQVSVRPEEGGQIRLVQATSVMLQGTKRRKDTGRRWQSQNIQPLAEIHWHFKGTRLKIQAARSSQTSLYFYWTLRHHISEYRIVHSQRRDNVK
jgi:hypothetical protein